MAATEEQPVIRHQAPCDEGWSEEGRGGVQWRTLFSGEHTPTRALTAGMAEIAPGDRLKAHRHAPPEIYHVLAGVGLVRVGEEEHRVEPGSSVFIPAHAVHGVHNTGRETLRFFYVFAADSFGEVDYDFQE